VYIFCILTRVRYK